MQKVVERAVGDELIDKQRDLGFEATSMGLHYISVVDLRQDGHLVDELFDLADHRER